MDKVNIYSIAWSEETYEVALESGYKILDNRTNERPDWYELWPIRKYILENGLKKDNYYGFFSSKFEYKTRLSSEEVYKFVSQSINQKADVVTFSPQPDQSAAFINVFEHANFYFPGFMDMAQEFFNIFEHKVELKNLIMDSRTTVFSNYFVAKADFWYSWLIYADKLFQIAESCDTLLGEKLNYQTNYGNGVQRKVFLQEEIASLMLTIYPNIYKCIPANSWKMGWGQMGFQEFKNEMIVSDALKIALRETGCSEYIEEYNRIRNEIIKKLF